MGSVTEKALVDASLPGGTSRPSSAGVSGVAPGAVDGTSPPLRPEELARLFEQFSLTTQRLQESHGLLEQRVAQLRNELAEKNLLLERKKRLEALGLMVAGVAHEIRNPLGSMTLYLDCLRQELRDEVSAETCERFVGQIEEAIEHLNSIVENMLVFTSAGRSAREPCRLIGLLDEAVQLLRNEIVNSRIEWSLRFDPTGSGVEERPADVLSPGDLCHGGFGRSATGEERDRAIVQGDPNQIRCVFMNVLKNAVQAVKGEGRISVALSSSQIDGVGHWVVRVCDTGPGIAEENLEKVFVPFFSDPGKKGGVGLGLTIVHSLMERQGGKVELANAGNGGLEVRLFFRGQLDRTGEDKELEA